MPPPALNFNLPPPTRHAPAPSLNLARSRPGPPSVAGSATSGTSDESKRRARTPTSATFSLRRGGNSISLPRTPLDLGSENTNVGSSETLPLPEGEPEPVDAGAWAASVHSYPPVSAGGGRPRVQFARDASVTLFDADTEACGSDDSEEYHFEPPYGKEMAAVVLSVTGITVLSLAAVLTTVYDWVL